MIDANQEIGFLFDLDGVIIDSESEYSRIWRLLNKEFPTGVENLEEVIKGCTLSKILNEFYSDEKTRYEVSLRLHEMEDQMVYNYLPFAEDFLKELSDRKICCALVTSSDNKKIAHLKQELPALLDYFDFVVTGDKVKASKPSPEGYLLGAAKINKDPRKCVVFEDSLQGVMAGRKAGAFVVGVCGTLSSEKIEPYSDLLINNFNEINLDDLIQILFER